VDAPAPAFPSRCGALAELRAGRQPLRYEMTLEPSRLPLLPLLELTPDRPAPRRSCPAGC
jgi:hypothetical protein